MTTVFDFVSTPIAVLNRRMTVSQMLSEIEKYKSQYGILVDENTIYQGVISKKDIKKEFSENFSSNVSSSKILTVAPIFAHQHWIESLSLFQKNIPFLPISSSEGVYLGVLWESDLVAFWSKNTFPIRSVLVLGFYDSTDYSLTQISRIVESENAKIMMVYSEIRENSEIPLGIHLAIDKQNILSIVEHFKRMSYIVEQVFWGQNSLGVAEKERLNFVLKYLSV